LGEEEQKSIHKGQISNSQTLNNTHVSQPPDWARKKLIEKTTSTYERFYYGTIIEGNAIFLGT